MLTELPAAPARPVQPEQGRPAPDRPGRRALRMLPAVVVVAFTVLTLRYHGVGLGVQARFAAQFFGVVLVPGVLVWRGLRRGSGTLPFDVAGGVALGYTMEIGWYLAGRAAGFPYLHVVAAAVVLVAFAAVPGLRRHWRGGAPADARWSWSVAALAVATMAVGSGYFRSHGLTWPGYRSPYVDMMFHQALAGELRHHLPAEMPMVAGTPLAYHWFVHAEWAAASWSSGVGTFLLTYRLGLTPGLLLLVLGFAVVGQRIIPGRWWSGPAVAALAVFAIAPDPARWSEYTVPPSAITTTLFGSPTQTFGAVIFAGAVLVAADLLDIRRRAHAGLWAAFVIAIAGATGAKATFAPLLAAAVLAVAAVALLQGRFAVRAAVLAGISLLAFGVASLTVFPGTSAGLVVEPLASLSSALPPTDHPGWTAGHTAAIWALNYAAIGFATLLLLRVRGWRNPLLTMCAGLGVAALVVVLVTWSQTWAQTYFLVSARPYVAVLVVAALIVAMPTGPQRRRRRIVVAAAFACGIAACALPGWLGPDTAPLRGTAAILWPFAVPVAVAALVGVVLAASPRNRPAALVATLAALAGAAVPSSIDHGTYAATNAIRGAPPEYVPEGALKAGAWLQKHTDPDDLLATNDHCYIVHPVCDPRQFWLAAVAERRVLVHGWSYTPPDNVVRSRTNVWGTQFWDQEKLARNDAVFRQPTAANVAYLHSRYGVDYLVVNARRPLRALGLGEYAKLRYRASNVWIYQITGDR